jgi:IS5 family transposase
MCRPSTRDRQKSEQVSNPDRDTFLAMVSHELRTPSNAILGMVGLHYLKYLFDESDESVVEKYVENPYRQFFCGRAYFEHELPCHPTSLVRWRHRIGAEGMEKLLTETLSTAKRKQALKESEVRRVNVDTTVQEKAVAFPTDARLYHKARRSLVRAAATAALTCAGLTCA